MTTVDLNDKDKNMEEDSIEETTDVDSETETKEEEKEIEQDSEDGSEEDDKDDDIDDDQDKEDGGKEENEENDGQGDENDDQEDDNMKYLRLMAEFQNYKKRVEKEKTDLYSFANEKLVTEILEVLDNFERALEHDEETEGFKEGMDMIFKQLSGVLEKSGLAEINALGEDFDPKFHNAVMTEETEEYESGKVSGVMQKGYTLNGKVIRPAMVKVVG